MRKRWLVCAVAFVWLAVPVRVFAAQDGSLKSRPNILFLFTDDHARHAIGAYGSKINKTPNLDRLASEGMLFRNCFCTNSICAPSRAVIQTGKHSHINGVIDNRVEFESSQQTFPKLLQKAGYNTAIVGKWHLKSEPIGFDYWEVLPGQGQYYNPIFRKAGDQKTTYTGYSTDVVVDRTLDWLRSGRDPEKPFMLMCQFKAPHRHWQPALRYLSMYDDVTIPEPATLFDDYSGRVSVAKKTTMTIAKHFNDRDLKFEPPPSINEAQLKEWNAFYDPRNEAMRKANLSGKDWVRWQYQRYIKDYLRCIAAVDDNIGRVLDYLDATGLADNTVVMYSSDQGFYLGDHGWFDKRWMYEESLTMPLIVRWPGVTEAGSENGDLVQNLDFAETFLDLAGANVPADMQGRSLVPILKGSTPADWRKSIYYHYYEFPGFHDVRRHYGVRTDRYKLIHYYDIDEWELFDLQKDPKELHSVYDASAYADVVKTLKAEVKRLRKHYKVDQFKEPPPAVDPQKVKLELVLRYDPAGGEDDTIKDLSGEGHEGKCVGVRIVEGLHGKAMAFDGKSNVQIEPYPESLNPTYRPMTVGAWCRPTEGDGVLVSHGEECFGYSLYLLDRRAIFEITAGQNRFLVKSPKPIELGRWTHVAGTIDANAAMTLWIDGQPVDRLDEALYVNDRPWEGFSIGADIGKPAGSYKGMMPFAGLIEDVRLYWAVPDETTLKAWAAR